MVCCNIRHSKFAIFSRISSFDPSTHTSIRKPQLLHFLHRSPCVPFQEFSCSSHQRTKHRLLFQRRYADTAYFHTHGPFSFASQVFDEMPPRNQHMSGLRDVLKIVRFANVEPTVVNAEIVHALGLKQCALAYPHIATSLLTVYSRSGELAASLKLFNDVLDKDLVLWNALMTGFVENKCFVVALELFVKMVGHGNEFDATTLVIVVSAFTDLRSLGQGKVVHGLSIKTGMLSDTILSNAVIDMYAKCGDLRSSECLFAAVEGKDLVTWNSIISGCFYNGCPEKSLSYFARMAASEYEVNGVTISSAMAACTSCQYFDYGLAIHGLGIKLGFAETNYISVANSLISFYSQIRDVYAAERVFKRMTAKNVVSWNAMIKGFVFNGEAGAVFYLLHSMQFEASIEPDLATVVTVVPLCAELNLLQEGKAFHCFAIRREMTSELSVINSFINMYSKCGNIENAEYLFLTLPNKDLVACNTMMFGYSQNGQSEKAQKLFKKMMVSCPQRTLPTLLAITRSCESEDSLQLGRSIHGWHIKLGFSDQLYAVNSLMHMYINCGVPVDAFTLFSGIYLKADVSSWNTVISGCTQKGHFLKALEYFDFMRKISRVYYDTITLVSAVSACGNLGLAFEGKLVHGLALKTQAGSDIRVQNSLVTMYGRLGDTENARLAFELSDVHNICSWNSIISAHSQNEDAVKALQLFRYLEFKPNAMTVSTVLSACTQLGSITYGKQIHGHVSRFRFQDNPFVSAALIDMYSNCGRLDIAERVFQTSPGKSIAAWNALISAYGYNSFGSKAVETFQEMVDSGFHPNNSTFTSLLSACSHSGLVDEGMMCYANMLSEFRVQPTVEHHVCVVDMLGRSGKLNEAYDLIKNLASPPDAGIWGTLLSACSYHGDLEMGRQVAEILFYLEPGNVSYLVTLCNMYVAAGSWEEAVELRNLIQDKRLRKPIGFSVVDVR